MTSSLARTVASGSTDTFSVPFPYLSKTHVAVSLDGELVPSTDYTWPTDGSIQLVAGNPTAGTIVERRRATPSDPLVTFTPGNLEASDLNTSARQALYVAQEGVDSAGDAIDRAWYTEDYQPGGKITKGPEGYTVVYSATGDLVPGPDVGDITSAQGYAEAALEAKEAALEAKEAALEAKEAAEAAAATIPGIDPPDVGKMLQAGEDGYVLVAGLPPLSASASGLALLVNAAGDGYEFGLASSIPLVASFAEMLALDPAKTPVCLLNDRLRGGLFRWDGSDHSLPTAWGTSEQLLGAAVTTTAVNASTDTATANAHGFFTSQAVMVTAAVNGLATNTIYYVIRVDANNFKLATNYANSFAGTAIDLTGTTNFTVQQHRDPERGVYVTPASALNGSAGAWVRQYDGEVRARWFGCRFLIEAAFDESQYLQAAIMFAGMAQNGAQGRIVRLPSGVGYIGKRLHQVNRVSIRGENNRGTVLRPHSTFASDYMIFAGNGTSSMFGATLEDMMLDARGTNMTGVVQSVAWQESSGMKRVCVQFDGTTPYGVVLQDGYGGAAFTSIEDCEVFANTTAALGTGILVGQISSIGGFVLSLERCTITGSAANILPYAVRQTTDSITCNLLHCEFVTSMISMNGAGNLHAESCTGSGNSVTHMVSRSAGHTGKVSLRLMIPNGATGNILNQTTSPIAASGGVLANYTN